MSLATMDIPSPFGLGDLSVLKFLQDSKVILDTATITTCIPGVPYPTGHSGYPGYPGSGSEGYTTVYTTECIQVCPTETPCPKGTKTATYTITETCTGNSKDYTRPTIPPHFTTTVTVCDVCEGKPTLTITLPGPEATSGNSGYVTAGGSQGTGGAGGAGSGGECNECNANGKGNGGNGNVNPSSSPANSTVSGGIPTNKNGYAQSSIASTGRNEAAAMLFGCVVGVAAWLL